MGVERNDDGDRSDDQVDTDCNFGGGSGSVCDCHGQCRGGKETREEQRRDNEGCSS